MMQVLSLPSLPGLRHSSPTPVHPTFSTSLNPPPCFSIKLGPGSNDLRFSPAGDFFRLLSGSSILCIGLSLSSVWVFSHPASARISPAFPPSSVHPLDNHDIKNVEKFENLETDKDEDMKLAFERWKSKSYALTVPLRIVALEGSLPPVWIREFLRSQGKRMRFRPEFRRNVRDIFHELSDPFSRGKINPKSAAAADVVTIGDSWLDFVIGKGLLEPLNGVENQNWFRELSEKWKVYLRRSTEGNLDPQGRIWAIPYRWGSMVIAYNKKEFRKRKLAPVEDWSDLWRPELAGKISMVDSPREIVGAVLKYMGASYNTTDIDSQVVGGKIAVLEQLELLSQQVRLFDSQHYLKALRAGDVWVAVGWSSDVIPVAKTMSNVAVMVPKSGASLWADFWAIPATSRLVTDQIGGRVRGASPSVQQWVEFCLQPQRTLPFDEGIIPGASPLALKPPMSEQPRLPPPNGRRPKLETNLIANIPPADILSKCELLEPMAEEALSDYKWLISSLQKPNHTIIHQLRLSISSLVPAFWSKIQSMVAA